MEKRTRANVSGGLQSHRITQLADGGSCMTVTDVVIVDGEEPRCPSACAAPRRNRYAKV